MEDRGEPLEEEPIREGEEGDLPEVDPDEVGHGKIAKAARKKLLALIEKDSLTDAELTQFRALASLVTEETKLETALASRREPPHEAERTRRVKGRLGDVRSRLTRTAAGM